MQPTRQDLIPRSEVRKMIEKKMEEYQENIILKEVGAYRRAMKSFQELLSELDNLSGVSDTSKVTRVEVIDEHGRAWTTYNASNVKIDLQDDDRTLKIFLISNKSPAIDPVEIIEEMIKEYNKGICCYDHEEYSKNGSISALEELKRRLSPNPSSHEYGSRIDNENV